MAPFGQLYKIKLASGRVLGPIALERVRLLISKNHIIGKEIAKVHPSGEWKNINQIPEIADLFVAKADGRLPSPEDDDIPDTPDLGGALPGSDPAATAILAPLKEIPEAPEPPGEESPQKTSGKSRPTRGSASALAGADARTTQLNPLPDGDEDEAGVDAHEALAEHGNDEEKTRLDFSRHADEGDGETEVTLSRGEDVSEALIQAPPRQKISEMQTVIFQRSVPGTGPKPRKRKESKFGQTLKTVMTFLAVAMVYHSLFIEEEPKRRELSAFVPIRPLLPDVNKGAPNPELSGKVFASAMPFYLQDTVVGYKEAAERFRRAVALDSNNVKALAMLASSYLNLIDSSNKDEKYFSVISRLIDMSRSKSLDLPETVIADVEFYTVVNKAEAAQTRIVEYTKRHQNFDLSMYFYLGQAFAARGDFNNAARYVGQFPETKIFSAKIFYLRGRIAEQLGDLHAAENEYSKGVVFNKNHAKSRLRLAALLNKRGKIDEGFSHLDFLVTHQSLLAPKDLGQAYFLHAQLAQAHERWDIALGDIERATRLDRENHDYLLEMYTLRAKVGDKSPAMRADARMFFYLGEGEKLVRQGKFQDALTQFLHARQANDGSPLPPVKIGDMFMRLNDVGNARINYKLAADRAPNSIDIWTKYIHVLIQSYEWPDAQKAMDKFRKMPVPQSAIDKAAADMYARQGRDADAQVFYKKAMAREVIDSTVYVAYANSLMATRNYADAPFFFALALRLDPVNMEAVIGTAKCIAATETIDRAISMLQDELQKREGSKAELLAAIAEFQLQKGDIALSQANIEQAMAANQDYAYPWKLQAQIYVGKENQERGALEKALFAYQSYSERNPSDPSGYLERYKIYVKRSEFEKANEELQKIYVIYPRYPNLHYYKGALYSIMGNRKAAIEEFRQELSQNPNSVQTLLALGRELVEAGAVNDAMGYFSKAMQLAPKLSDPKAEAAYGNYLLKNYAAAVALYQAALSIDRANPLLYKRMGMAYREAGDPGSAAVAFRKYLEMEPDAPDRTEFERYR